MNDQKKKWAPQYAKYVEAPVYPTEWVVRTLAGGNYPNLKLDKTKYKGKKILDISCGDGRNLQLLINLGFDVHATEISDEIVNNLKKRFPKVNFDIGLNNKQPFGDNYFDYILSSSACYYLEPKTNFQDNLNEISRILKPKGYFIGNIPDMNNSVVNNAKVNAKGEATITEDPFGLRNGYRLQVCYNKMELQNLLRRNFQNVAIGSFLDDYYGLKVSGFMFVGQKQITN